LDAVEIEKVDGCAGLSPREGPMPFKRLPSCCWSAALGGQRMLNWGVI